MYLQGRFGIDVVRHVRRRELLRRQADGDVPHRLLAGSVAVAGQQRDFRHREGRRRQSLDLDTIQRGAFLARRQGRGGQLRRVARCLPPLRFARRYMVGGYRQREFLQYAQRAVRGTRTARSAPERPRVAFVRHPRRRVVAIPRLRRGRPLQNSCRRLRPRGWPRDADGIQTAVPPQTRRVSFLPRRHVVLLHRFGQEPIHIRRLAANQGIYPQYRFVAGALRPHRGHRAVLRGLRDSFPHQRTGASQPLTARRSSTAICESSAFARMPSRAPYGSAWTAAAR